MKTRFAVIDLGTNTFHLLIVEKGEDLPFKEIFRKRVFVKLAAEGIETIGKTPFERGVSTMMEFQKYVEKNEVDQIRLLATEGIRRASNGQDFINTIKAKTGFQIDLISGDEEARLIHLGVNEAVPFGDEKNMIIDIGGGSVEFIIADKEGVHWAQSFPIGVAVLKNNFHENNPITNQELNNVNDFLTNQLKSLLEILPKLNPINLIGASGAFEVIEKMLPHYRKDVVHSVVPIKEFYPLYQKIIPADLEALYEMEGLPNSRADLIIVAFQLIHFVLEKANFQNLIISDYAMKEGALSEMLKNQTKVSLG